MASIWLVGCWLNNVIKPRDLLFIAAAQQFQSRWCGEALMQSRNICSFHTSELLLTYHFFFTFSSEISSKHYQSILKHNLVYHKHLLIIVLNIDVNVRLEIRHSREMSVLILFLLLGWMFLLYCNPCLGDLLLFSLPQTSSNTKML